MHELTPENLEHFLAKFTTGWSRWSEHKRLRPFYKFALRRRWIAADPLADIPTPKTPTPDREIYTPSQFQSLLYQCEKEYPSLLPYVVLCGFCFLRTAELVRRFKSKKVLRWEHVLWKEKLIHVPPGVAKSTRRRDGDERNIPLNDAAREWLGPIRQKTGECVPHGSTHFGKLWREMTGKAEVPRIDNGLRHSAISYALAADPKLGVALVSQYAGNSEATVKKHYRRLIKPAAGKAWFEVMHSDEVDAIIAAQEAARQQPGYDPDAF